MRTKNKMVRAFLISTFAGTIASCFTIPVSNRYCQTIFQESGTGRGYIRCKASALLSSASETDHDKIKSPSKPKKLTPEAEELEHCLKTKGETGKLIVAQTAPSVRVAFSELFGKAPGDFAPGLLVASLKALGFDIVLDTNTAADLTICEEGTELLHRISLRKERCTGEEGKKSEPSLLEGTEIEGPLPLFTSCCPGWMNFIAKKSPELVPYVSSCKSPHMMLGAM